MTPAVTRYRVVHRTTYRYSAPMVRGDTVTHLLPRTTEHQDVISAHVDVDPQPDDRSSWIDTFGNRVEQIAIHRSHDALTVDGRSEVEVRTPAVPAVDVPWEAVRDAAAAARADLALDVMPFVPASPLVDHRPLAPELRAFTDGAFTPGRPAIEAIDTLCRTIHATMAFDPGFTDVSTPLAAVLSARRGVCQDFAHLAVACLRTAGLPARYVSGYIETEPPPGRPRLVGADASHAWCATWIPGVGWIDFDPTNAQFPPRRHVTVAWGRDVGDVSPVRGVVVGPPAEQQLEVSVDVQRAPEV